MSAYGPALFVSRKDQQPIDKAEQDAIVALVQQHARRLELTDDDDQAVSPRFYDYGEYEKSSVAVLMYSSQLTTDMPDDIREDHEQAACDAIMKIAKSIEKERKGEYAFKAYYVED